MWHGWRCIGKAPACRGLYAVVIAARNRAIVRRTPRLASHRPGAISILTIVIWPRMVSLASPTGAAMKTGFKASISRAQKNNVIGMATPRMPLPTGEIT